MTGGAKAVGAVDAVERALEVVQRWEAAVRAFVHLDPDRARTEARATEAQGGPLAGVILGVKDIFDTADQPTEYGSPIYAGHRPRADAAAVALLRAAGATVLGKTVTTEFAVFHPGPTGNPHRVAHTPGGSSSGSAAAVACGMVDIALGTQTAGSVIRPASYCGVLGFKPTYGTVATAGCKPVAPSLDTVGWFARDVALLDRVRVALTDRRPASVPLDGTPRLAVVRTARWEDASDDARAAVEETARLASAAGAAVVDATLPEPFDRLAADQPVVMGYELARSLAWEWHRARDRLSSSLQDLVARGLATDPDAYDDIRARALLARATADHVFSGADALLTLSANGEAPPGHGSTGNPQFARLWTLLGLPAISMPAFTGATRLPIGVQLVGRAGRDADLLATAEWLARVLPPAPAPTL